jgi:hypothetical protein
LPFTFLSSLSGTTSAGLLLPMHSSFSSFQ